MSERKLERLDDEEDLLAVIERLREIQGDLEWMNPRGEIADAYWALKLGVEEAASILAKKADAE